MRLLLVARDERYRHGSRGQRVAPAPRFCCGRQPRFRAGASAPRSSSSFCGEGGCGLTGRRGDGVEADDLLPDFPDALDVADELVAGLEESPKSSVKPQNGSAVHDPEDPQGFTVAVPGQAWPRLPPCQVPSTAVASCAAWVIMSGWPGMPSWRSPGRIRVWTKVPNSSSLSHTSVMRSTPSPNEAAGKRMPAGTSRARPAVSR